MKVLILGVNGFIGSHLLRRILGHTSWTVIGLDLQDFNLGDALNSPNFAFKKGDLGSNWDWVEEQIKECDVIMPLIAIAQPKLYVEDPLRVFGLDFEDNLKIIRWTVEYKKWVLFPSTSEVYGMSADNRFSEDTTNLVYGPIHRMRWIYASSKQLLDRLIYAYGEKEGLEYTIFRPFNWVGPRQDTLEAAQKGHTRVMTQFFAFLIDGKPIQVVNGGYQKRSFTDIDDGIDALMLILQNRQKSLSKIFNIGNPVNVSSIADLAKLVRKTYGEVTGIEKEKLSVIETVDEEAYYGLGKGFQDIESRVPDITNISQTLGWHPKVDLETSVLKCANFFLKNEDN